MDDIILKHSNLKFLLFKYDNETKLLLCKPFKVIYLNIHVFMC